MLKVTVKWWLKSGRKTFGTDTFLTDNADIDEDSVKDIMDQADTYTEELKTKLPNFYWKHVESNSPEDWGVSKLTVAQTNHKEETKGSE